MTFEGTLQLFMHLWLEIPNLKIINNSQIWSNKQEQLNILKKALNVTICRPNQLTHSVLTF